MVLHAREQGEQAFDLTRLQRRRRFVEDQHAALPAQCPGDGDQLSLGKAQAIDADIGIRCEVKLPQLIARHFAHACAVNDIEACNTAQRRIAKREVLGD